MFSIDGKRVAPAVVPTKKVTALYKPIHAKNAAAVFGLAFGDFTGNKTKAKAEAAAFASGTIDKDGLQRSARLEDLLRGRSLMTKTNKPFFLWFSETGGEQNGRASSGILVSHFASWIATPNGLVCMFDAFWDNGNPIGDRCLYIDSIANGQVRFAWTSSIGRSHKAQLLQGDARFAAVR
ncbi:hypothetical protein NBRC116594_17690 [Shimia sp. NS0008-38b]